MSSAELGQDASETAGQTEKLVKQGPGHDLMSVVVGMQEVVGIVEFLRLLLDEREQAGKIAEVYHGNGPYLLCLFDGFHILVEIEPCSVLIGFIQLYVLIFIVKERAMEWGEYHHLLVGIHGLDLSHGYVDAPFQCLWVVVEMSSESCNGLSGLVPPLNVSLFFGFGVPNTDGQIGVIVVCSDEYQYGIKLVAVFFAEAVGLVGDIIPLPTVHGIDIAGGMKPFF